MSLRRIILIVLASLLVIAGLLLYLNRDKIVYVGSIKLVEIDCANAPEILDSVYVSDQRIRQGGVPFAEFARQDHKNQELVISILEKCGMPTLDEATREQLNAIWLVIQHTRRKYREKYFPLIEEGYKNGLFSSNQYATMKDRILMDRGEPQLYGSQIKNGQLYKLDSPAKVNERREKMGMEPLEVYLRRFNTDFDPDG